jgi:hypothetical protein
MTPPKHILGTFDEALVTLRNNVLMMASLATRSLDNALNGLLQRDDDLCATAIADDEEIDQLEKQVDKDGIDLLLRFQPVASDLRRVVSALIVRHGQVWGDSALIIVNLTGVETGADRVSETLLDLKQGRISGTVKKLSAASKYEVKLPNGVAGIRGTIFDIQAAGVIKVYVGSMVVAWVDPTTQQVTTQTVMGGQSYDVISKQVSLLPPESMSDLAELSANLQVGQILPTVTTLATDRTVVGMSPVGANSSTLPQVQSNP